jgi:hypothetical protein
LTIRPAVGGFVVAIAAIAAILFIGVAIHELGYASGHPYAYGPARVIALACAGGAALSVAVGLLGSALVRDGTTVRRP